MDAHMTIAEIAENVGEHAAGLLERLRPWPNELRNECVQLTLALTQLGIALDRKYEKA